MARTLDLNTIKRPTLDVTLQDEARTKLRISTPSEGLVRELEALSPELPKLASGERDAIEEIYDLAGRLMSCNRDFIKVTGEELRGKYRMDLESAIIFFSAYMDFIDEINKTKN